MSFAARFARYRSGWGFIYALGITLILWFVWNSFTWALQFDAPPFILLNLLLSVEASFAMPVLLMEQARAVNEERARRQEEHDHLVALIEQRPST